MSDYRFSLIVAMAPPSHDDILDMTDKLGAASGCDASLRGHADGLELLFERTADSLQNAIRTAIADVERAGFRVARVEMEREAIAV